jgi:hypothetical protein
MELMKANLKTTYVVMVAMAAMTACGGSGDDNAGQLSEFQVSPAEMKLTTGTAACPGPNAKAGDFLVVGGTAPYTAFSSDHQNITFGPAGSTAPTVAGTYEIPNRNNQVAIFVTGCFDPGIVTVLDNLKRVAIISVTAASGSGS